MTTQRGDTVEHIPEILAQVLASEIRSGNIVSVEAIVPGEPINALIYNNNNIYFQQERSRPVAVDSLSCYSSVAKCNFFQ